jgi:hypothetical protein
MLWGALTKSMSCTEELGNMRGDREEGNTKKKKNK